MDLKIKFKEEYILEILKDLLKFLEKNYSMTFIIIVWNVIFYEINITYFI